MPRIEDMKTVAEWARLDGVNYNTSIKRRAASGLGTLVPPRTWLLTKKEWEEVKRTPVGGGRTA